MRAVVGSLADRPVDLVKAAIRVGERGPRRVADSDVVQAGDAVGLRPAASRLPGVEPEVVVIAAGRHEQEVAGRAPARHVACLGDDVEAEHIDVEVPYPVDVRCPKVDMADGDAGSIGRVLRSRGTIEPCEGLQCCRRSWRPW